MYGKIKEEFGRIIKEHGLVSEPVTVRAIPLSPEEAIGNPEDKDYPLITGAERMMQAEFRGVRGQAFTDMYGDYQGTLAEILDMELKNNFRRAVLVATLNAVMKYLGLIEKSCHCRDTEPRQCSEELVRYMEINYGNPRIALVGLQPRMAEALGPRFALKVTDLDKSNIGSEKFGVLIEGPEKTAENLDWCDVALVTGTTVVNNTIGEFMLDKPVVFYGVTVSGVAKLLGLEHFCVFGK